MAGPTIVVGDARSSINRTSAIFTMAEQRLLL
jgi:hypothetical protein